MPSIFYETTLFLSDRTQNAFGPEQLDLVRQIFSSKEELKKRALAQKKRFCIGEKSYVVYGLRFGQGRERSKERLLFTVVDRSVVLLDYLPAHEYHRTPFMEEAYFKKFIEKTNLEHLQVVEVDKSDESRDNEDLSSLIASDFSFQPVYHKGDAEFLMLSADQSHLIVNYSPQAPLFLEGLAGSGKTLCLKSFIDRLVLDQSFRENVQSEKEILYLYPRDSIALGQEIERSWSAHRTKDILSQHRCSLKAASVEAILPESLYFNHIKRFEDHVRTLITRYCKYHLVDALAVRVYESGYFNNDSFFDYLWLRVLFKDNLSLWQNTISQKKVLGEDVFRAIDMIYQELKKDSSALHFFSLLTDQPPQRYFSSYVFIDEAQNIPLPALVWLLHQAQGQLIVFSGDQHQQIFWHVMPTLEALYRYAKAAFPDSDRKQLSSQYRSPRVIQHYAHQTIEIIDDYLGPAKKSGSGIDAVELQQEDCEIFAKIEDWSDEHLSGLLQRVPSESPDFFIIGTDKDLIRQKVSQSFPEKNFLIFTPEEIPGLETKFCLLWDLLPWDLFLNSAQAVQTETKRKTRLQIVTPEQSAIYSAMTRYFTALTRASQKVILLSSPPSSKTIHRFEALQNLKKNLFDSIPLLAMSDPLLLAAYRQGDKDSLEKIYQRLQGQSAKDFYEQHLKKYDQEIIQDQKLSGSDLIVVSDTLKPKTLSEKIEIIGSNEDGWGQLNLTNVEELYEIVFQQYGKMKKSFFNRVILALEVGSSSPQLQKKFFKGSFFSMWESLKKYLIQKSLLDESFYKGSYKDKKIYLWLSEAMEISPTARSIVKELLEISFEKHHWLWSECSECASAWQPYSSDLIEQEKKSPSKSIIFATPAPTNLSYVKSINQDQESGPVLNRSPIKPQSSRSVLAAPEPEKTPSYTRKDFTTAILQKCSSPAEEQKHLELIEAIWHSILESDVKKESELHIPYIRAVKDQHKALKTFFYMVAQKKLEFWDALTQERIDLFLNLTKDSVLFLAHNTGQDQKQYNIFFQLASRSSSKISWNYLIEKYQEALPFSMQAPVVFYRDFFECEGIREEFDLIDQDRRYLLWCQLIEQGESEKVFDNIKQILRFYLVKEENNFLRKWLYETYLHFQILVSRQQSGIEPNIESLKDSIRNIFEPYNIFDDAFKAQEKNFFKVVNDISSLSQWSEYVENNLSLINFYLNEGVEKKYLEHCSIIRKYLTLAQKQSDPRWALSSLLDTPHHLLHDFLGKPFLESKAKVLWSGVFSETLWAVYVVMERKPDLWVSNSFKENLKNNQNISFWLQIIRDAFMQSFHAQDRRFIFGSKLFAHLVQHLENHSVLLDKDPLFYTIIKQFFVRHSEHLLFVQDLGQESILMRLLALTSSDFYDFSADSKSYIQKIFCLLSFYQESQRLSPHLPQDWLDLFRYYSVHQNTESDQQGFFNAWQQMMVKKYKFIKIFDFIKKGQQPEARSLFLNLLLEHHEDDFSTSFIVYENLTWLTGSQDSVPLKQTSNMQRYENDPISLYLHQSQSDIALHPKTFGEWIFYTYSLLALCPEDLPMNIPNKLFSWPMMAIFIKNRGIENQFLLRSEHLDYFKNTIFHTDAEQFLNFSITEIEHRADWLGHIHFFEKILNVQSAENVWLSWIKKTKFVETETPSLSSGIFQFFPWLYPSPSLLERIERFSQGLLKKLLNLMKSRQKKPIDYKTLAHLPVPITMKDGRRYQKDCLIWIFLLFQKIQRTESDLFFWKEFVQQEEEKNAYLILSGYISSFFWPAFVQNPSVELFKKIEHKILVFCRSFNKKDENYYLKLFLMPIYFLFHSQSVEDRNLRNLYYEFYSPEEALILMERTNNSSALLYNIVKINHDPKLQRSGLKNNSSYEAFVQKFLESPFLYQIGYSNPVQIDLFWKMLSTSAVIGLASIEQVLCSHNFNPQRFLHLSNLFFKTIISKSPYAQSVSKFYDALVQRLTILVAQSLLKNEEFFLIEALVVNWTFVQKMMEKQHPAELLLEHMERFSVKIVPLSIPMILNLYELEKREEISQMLHGYREIMLRKRQSKMCLFSQGAEQTTQKPEQSLVKRRENHRSFS